MLTRLRLGKWEYPYIVLMLCWVAWIINYVDRMILPPVLPLIAKDFNLTYVQAGLLMTAFLIGYAIMQLPAGFLSDRYGRKTLLIPGMIGYSTATFLTGISMSFNQILALRALTGFCQGTHLSVANSLISDFFPQEKRGRAIGIHESGPNVGSTLALPLTASVAAVWGWRWPFLLYSLPGFVLVFIFWRVVREPKLPLLVEHWGSKPIIVNRLRLLFPFVVAKGGYSLCNWALFTFIPIYLVKVRGMNIVTAGAVAAVMPAIGIVAKVMGGSISDLIGRRSVMGLALGSIAPLLYLFTIIENSHWLVVVLAAMGLSLFSFSPAIYAGISDSFTSSRRGTALGFVNTMGFAIGSVSPVLFGFLVDSAGFEAAFWFLSLVALLSALISTGFIRVDSK